MILFQGSKQKLQYAAWGDPTDRATVFFHGFPGSHLQGLAVLPFLKENRVFLIATDRPGYGGSEPSIAFNDYLDSVDELLSHLGVHTFDIVGVSGGAPWAHMMASRFWSKVGALAIVCGISSFNSETADLFGSSERRGLRLSRWVPKRIMTFVLDQVLRIASTEKGSARFVAGLDAADRRMFETEARRLLLDQSFTHAQRQGSKGIVHDLSVYRQDWLSTLCDISQLAKIRVTYYHGLQDHILDPLMSNWMHNAVAHSKLRLFESEGHYSLAFDQVDVVLKDLKN